MTGRKCSMPDLPAPTYDLLTRINGLDCATYGGTIGLGETLQLMMIREAARRNLRVPDEALAGFVKMPQEAVLLAIGSPDGAKEVQ